MAKAIKISKRILTLLMKTFLLYRIAKHLGKKKCSLNASTCKWKKKKGTIIIPLDIMKTPFIKLIIQD